ncbi:MAG: GHKL domain-containing protein [Eubacteriales bacterium]
MINAVVDYIFCLFDIIAVTILLIITNRNHLRGKLFTILSPIIYSLLLYYSNFVPFNVINVILDYVVVSMLVVTVVNKNMTENIYTFLSIIITLGILDMISAFFVIKVFHVTLEQSIQVVIIKFVAWFISRGVLLVIYPKINFYFNALNVLQGKSKYSLFIFSIFDLIYLLLGYAIYSYYYNIDISVFILMMIGGLIVFNYLLNNLLHKIYEIGEQEKEWERKEALYRLRLNNIEQEYEYIDHFHREKHDFNQHLQMILAYISTEQYVKAKNYIFTLTGKIDHLSEMNNSKYPEIFSFINYKANLAINKGIDVQKEIEIPNDLFVDVIDLTIVLGNLMDNAIEANGAMTAGEKKILLKVYERNNYLIIHTENPYQEVLKNKDNRFISTKEDKHNHGIGLQNIQFIAEKYCGFIDIDYNNKFFIIKIALENLKEEESFQF